MGSQQRPKLTLEVVLARQQDDRKLPFETKRESLTALNPCFKLERDLEDRQLERALRFLEMRKENKEKQLAFRMAKKKSCRSEPEFFRVSGQATVRPEHWHAQQWARRRASEGAVSLCSLCGAGSVGCAWQCRGTRPREAPERADAAHKARGDARHDRPLRGGVQAEQAAGVDCVRVGAAEVEREQLLEARLDRSVDLRVAGAPQRYRLVKAITF